LKIENVKLGRREGELLRREDGSGLSGFNTLAGLPPRQAEITEEKIYVRE
jgi:hypothetical protein